MSTYKWTKSQALTQLVYEGININAEYHTLRTAHRHILIDLRKKCQYNYRGPSGRTALYNFWQALQMIELNRAKLSD